MHFWREVGGLVSGVHLSPRQRNGHRCQIAIALVLVMLAMVHTLVIVTEAGKAPSVKSLPLHVWSLGLFVLNVMIFILLQLVRASRVRKLLAMANETYLCPCGNCGFPIDSRTARCRCSECGSPYSGAIVRQYWDQQPGMALSLGLSIAIARVQAVRGGVVILCIVALIVGVIAVFMRSAIIMTTALLLCTLYCWVWLHARILNRRLATSSLLCWRCFTPLEQSDDRLRCSKCSTTESECDVRTRWVASCPIHWDILVE